jgi:peptidoglycan/LPS O-acetylase OafA/YrhL
MGESFAGAFLYDWRVWIVAAFAAASASYYLLELPVLTLRKRFRPGQQGADTMKAETAARVAESKAHFNNEVGDIKRASG